VIKAAIAGILMGGIYALIAVGLNLIFGVMKILNFAHGTLMMIGMYISYWLFTHYSIDPYLSVVITIPSLFILGTLIQKYLINPILHAPEYNQLLLTLGVMLLFENIAIFLWSPDYRSINVSYSMETVSIGNVLISFVKIIAFGLAVALTGLLYLFLKKTKIGRAIRASSDEREGAILMGINVSRMYWLSFGIGSACAGVAGSTITPFFYIFPHVGTIFILKTFIVVVLGGLGSFGGALIGGLIVGISESLGAVIIPGSLKDIVTFVIFVLILIFRPKGILGMKET